MILPKGTIIEVSNRESIIKRARGLHIRSREIFDTDKPRAIRWEIVKDPNGWGKPQAYYTPSLKHDKILSAGEGNEYASLVLERWDKD